ncbi:MAG: hypothetical protein DGJ47_000866 [Rickettsiaceae bacterium]
MSFKKFHVELNSDLAWRLLLLLSAICVVMTSSEAAFAGANDDIIGNTLCRLVANLGGGIARGIATLAIFAVGVGLFLGKLNWGIAAATAAGVGVIFGAPQLVAFLSGNADDATCPVDGANNTPA